MADSQRSHKLRAFIDLIKDDWNGRYRKYPDQTAFALQDGRVLAALEKRFAEESDIKSIRALDYDFYTGLHNLVFEFSRKETPLPFDTTASFLTILDGRGKVIAVVDPFDPVQPNKFVPPLPQEGDQPFVLDRPSPGSDVRFSDEDVYPVQVRSRSFFQRLKAGGSGFISGGAGLIPITINTYTLCTFQTTTPWGSGPDITLDDCGQPW